ncbi:retropepsin-like aspartic protease family protein [Rhabdochromatium marinum]|uniref:retropepsin-like aspartic protease family protein n=1 Tax=Rhabdochromatium marinum TaxID=48729 RepID=UPI001904EEC9|nr:TIGR02281 family clan AA aspartic protease [Rhabdochromatium marinum]MBK1647365.1 TIGR02281 family clan AA aspartic protease [Rhabdochromatium marinum]
MTDPLPNRDDLPSRLGNIMLFAAWVVGLALLGLFFHQYIEGEQNPNRQLKISAADPHGQAQVSLKRNRLGHYVAPGAINDEPVIFLIDTGASAVALPLELARELGLPLRPGGRSKTANGTVDIWTTRIDRLDIGALHAENIHAIVMPRMEGHEVLLGMTFLRRVELLQRDGMLTLRAPL